MRNFSLLFLTELFLGFASNVERNKCDQQYGDDSQKGPPGIKTADLAYLDAQIEPSQMMEQVTRSSHSWKWGKAV
jgi:hypothetical protein